MAKKRKISKGYKRVVDKRMRDYGEIDYSKKLIRVNPKKGDLINTIVHEELHRAYPDKSESWVRKQSRKKESSLTMSQAVNIMKKYMRNKDGK